MGDLNDFAQSSFTFGERDPIVHVTSIKDVFHLPIALSNGIKALEYDAVLEPLPPRPKQSRKRNLPGMIQLTLTFPP